MTLYVREAHPAEQIDQPDVFATKMANARAYKHRDAIDWPVAVDDLDGTLHRQLGPADTAYVMSEDGQVAARLLWATDVRNLRKALDAAASGAKFGERRARFLPLVRGTAEQRRIFAEAGPRASRDMLRTLPPVYVAGRIAGRLPSMPPLAKGTIATVVTTVLHVGVVGAVWTMARAIGSFRRSLGEAFDRR